MKKALKKALKKKHRNGLGSSSRSARSMHHRNARASSVAPTGRSSTDEAGKRTLKILGGAGVTATLCGLAARKHWGLPAPWLTALVGGLGGMIGVIGKTDTIRSVGNGIMSAAGGQFGLMLIDRHDDQVGNTSQSSSSPPPKKRDAESLPPGALEAAYERARRRLALSEAASQMAA